MELDTGSQRALEECYRLLEETGDVQACLARYPGLADEITGHLETQRLLAAVSASEPDPLAVAAGRRRLLSSVAVRRGAPKGILARLFGPALAGGMVGLTLMSLVVVGASAAGTPLPGPVDRVLAGLGLPNGDNGSANEATPVLRETATPALPGTGVIDSVSPGLSAGAGDAGS